MNRVVQKLPLGVQTFADIGDRLLYVDKTAYIAELIADFGTKAWFLSRPRRFGKSLLLSTLVALFSGQRKLFKGLAIEKRLDEEIFAARPVIRLDMSYAVTDMGIDEFRQSLGSLTSSRAIWQGGKWSLARFLSSSPKAVRFKLTPNLSPARILAELIEKLATKSGRKVAVLIDEYDKPYLDLIKRPDEAEKVREALRAFYSVLKASDEYISFIFVVGISKFTRMGVFSAMNNLTDISVLPKYASICGFTHEELSDKLGPYVEEAAQSLGMASDDLLAKLKDYYDGFSFDGVTRVYNPFSILLFLFYKRFSNYWFTSGTTQVISQYIKDKILTVEEFRGIEIGKDFAENPGEIDTATPASFFYQAGYLSLRPGVSRDSFILDYPNREVYESMSRLLVENFVGDRVIATAIFVDLRKALGSGDAEALIGEFTKFLAEIPYDIYVKANRKAVKFRDSEIKFDEWLYHATLLSFLIGAGVNVRAEEHTSHGQSDMVAIYAGRVWVIELKMVRDGNDEDVAQGALKQIRDKNYAGPYDNPLLLGIAINGAKRTIGAWAVEKKANHDA
ncbi:MAG: ATP-binding protein [Deltaproteobacteria bacterium]|jgi:hypothetical protein|nr:ATP-binding protein [Deltaproteobacteria bacterium]